MQLADVYSSLFCPPAEKTFSPPDIARALLEKQTERDASILQLSILRRSFQSKLLEDASIEGQPSSTHADSPQQLAAKRELWRILLSSHNFVDNLICQLRCTDQFISFCASKALVAVFLSCVVQVEWLSTLLSHSNAEWLYCHVAMYSWQVFTDLLKALRKQLLTHIQQENDAVLCKQNACFTVLLSAWSEILKLYTSAMTARDGQSSIACDRHGQCIPRHYTRLELSLGEFLSLTVEMLRHKCYSNRNPCSEQQVDSQIPYCQAAIVHSLLPIASLLEHSNSVTLLKRVLDILLKATRSPSLSSDTMDQLSPHLTDILKARTINRALRSWMSTVGSGLIQAAVGATISHQLQTVESTDNIEDSSFDTGLLSTVVRRLILFLLKFTTAVLEREAQSKGPAAFYSAHLDWVLQEMQVLASSAGWSVPSSRATQVAREVVFQVLSEQDDCVVEALLACCQIHVQYKCCGYNSDSSSNSLATCVNIFTPHSLFIEFLQSIAYDHTVLVDFLLSSENKFQDLFHEYLQITTSDWKQLKLTCLQYDDDDTRLSIPSITFTENVDSHNTAAVKLVNPYLDTVPSHGRGVQHEELGGDELGAQVVKRQKHTGDCHISEDPSTALSASSSSWDCGSTHDSSSDHERQSLYCETTLDRAMDCFTRLKFTLIRLGEKNLLPGIPTKDTVPLLESLERLYEQESFV